MEKYPGKKIPFSEISSPLAAQRPAKESGPKNSVGFPEHEVKDPLNFIPGNE